MRLEGKVAVITGGASGIGEATSTLFALEGASVVVADIDQDRGEVLASKIAAEDRPATFVRTDVTRPAEAERLVNTAVQKYGRLDILFNNAGIGLWGSVVDMDPDDWDRVMHVNLRGIFLPSKYAVPIMVDQGGGVIVNTGSGSGMVATANSAAYCASKAGVINLTRAMALDHGPAIRVNCVCPGVVDTPFNEAVLATMQDPELVLKAQREGNMLQRIALPEDIANAVLFLASDQSAYMTGASVTVDGGYTAK